MARSRSKARISSVARLSTPLGRPPVPRWPLVNVVAGIAMCHLHGSKIAVLRHPDGIVSKAETPVVIVDSVQRIVPPRHGQIDLGKIREPS